ncbi:unannotated protein [freshwater metagenome]|jgi:hypothetical protein|uniref:Unannotated protein n=1 Tax=freshwater metagenome TaxID=449393 RepID=A0A6J6I4C5_9ZZZZ
MAAFDPNEMITRFRDRAISVKKRPLPPIAGEERQLFIANLETDFRDFAIIGDATATIEDGVLTLRIDLNPPSK